MESDLQNIDEYVVEKIIIDNDTYYIDKHNNVLNNKFMFVGICVRDLDIIVCWWKKKPIDYNTTLDKINKMFEDIF
jgi:hypothetical protein